MVHICILSIIAILCTVIMSFIINNFNDKIIQSKKENNQMFNLLKENAENNKKLINKLANDSLDLAKIVEKQVKLYDKDKICLSGLIMISGKRFDKIEERLDLIENKIIKDNKTKSNKSNNKVKKE